MGSLDATFFNLAKNLTDKFGGITASLQTVTSVFDPVAGAPVETVAAETVSISPPSPVDLRALNGTLVQVGDMTSLVAAKGLTSVPVANTSRLVFNGGKWQITVVDPIYSGDDIAAYQIMLRQ